MNVVVKRIKRTRYILIGIIILSGFISWPAHAAMARNISSLDGNWEIIVDWYGVGNPQDIAADRQSKGKDDFVEFSFDKTQTLSVPGDWNSQRPDLKYYEGTVWYKRNFTVRMDSKKKYLLNFQGVSSQCDVFLNGHKLGSHEGSFTPFSFEVTGDVMSGENLLVVRVNNERRKDAIPAMKFDWWNYGGITRSVTLSEVPDKYISDFCVQLEKGTLDQLQGCVQTAGGAPGKITIAIPEAGFKRSFESDVTGKVSFTAKANLSLWSPENPKLYRVNIFTQTDTVSDEIGFRCIEVRGNKIYLNNKPVFLRGVSFHEEVPQRAARAYSETDSRMLLQWAKDLGCNFIRLAHYPQGEQTVRLAEKMGFMMWEEIPVWQGIDFADTAILAKASTMLHEMIQRDKNRCGIIIWSLSNETTPAPDRNKVLIRMAKEAREMDSARLISSAFDHFKYSGNKIIIDDPLGRYLDVIAANKYMGWYAKWPAGPGNVAWESVFNKPLIISEFGAEALYGNHGSADTAGLWTEEYQEKVYKDNIRMFNNISFLAGVCPWILADFRTPFRMQAQYQQGWNRKGLISDKGFKKKAWYIIHRFYEEKKKACQ